MDLASEIERNVAAALAEDVGAGDLTAPLTPADRSARALSCCAAGGRAVRPAVVRRLRAQARCRAPTVTWLAARRRRTSPPAPGSARSRATARALLTAERSALNFLQLLTAVATATRAATSTPSPARARRSWIPARRCPGCAWRRSTRCASGGGANHRIGLYDAHADQGKPHRGGRRNHAGACRAGRNLPAGAWIQIEVENHDQLREALARRREDDPARQHERSIRCARR